MTELFPTEELHAPSPRIRWMKEHMVHTQNAGADIDEPCVAWVKKDLDYCLEKATYSSCQEEYRHRMGVWNTGEKIKVWAACITVNRRTIHLGRFASFKDACKAREDAEIKYGFHPNHGKLTA